MDGRRVFSLEEVNELIPTLSAVVKEQLDRRAAIESLLGELGQVLGDVPERIVLEPGEPEEVRAMKRDILRRIDEYRSGWKNVEAMGAVLKDPRAGLVDFYGNVEGQLVWLCWKYGESVVDHYHRLEEGFAMRKPIAPGIRARLIN